MILISFYLFFFSYFTDNFILIILSTEISNVFVLHFVYKNFKKKFKISTSSNIYYILSYNFIGSVIAILFLNNFLIDNGFFLQHETNTYIDNYKSLSYLMFFFYLNLVYRLCFFIFFIFIKVFR